MGRTAVIGMFDGVHLGHRYLLDYAKDMLSAEERPLVVTFANHPLEAIRPESAPQLLTLPEEKRQLLDAQGVESLILPFTKKLAGLTAREFLVYLKDTHLVDRLVMGFNNRFGSDRGLAFGDYRAIGNALGISVVCAPEYPAGKISSSIIRELLREGNVAEAERRLGHPFALSGQVISGNQIGRTIGFPTANLAVADPRKIVPSPGVYAARAIIGETHENQHDNDYLAIVNIGHRPTIDDGGAIHIEAHLDGLSADLYGRALTLHFITRLRAEQKFPDLPALRAQLHRDLLAARSVAGR